MNKQPNILWICTDQQRKDTLGCYGNPWVNTPNLDAMAQTSAIFEHAYCQSPICTPSRSSFLTGRYPRTTRCRQNGQSIPEDEILVTQILADNGYHGGLSGKLHLSACQPKICQNNTERRIKDGYAEFNWSHDPRPAWPTNAYTQWLESKGKTYHTPNHPKSKYVQIGMHESDHQTTWCANQAIDFIRRRNAFPQPWFFSVNIFDPHHPFDPPTEYLERYLNRLDEIPLPDYQDGDLDDRPCFQQIDHENAYNVKDYYPYEKMTPTDHRMVRATSWAMVDLIDVQVGRMLDALRQTGQLENTLVIFMSDHGEMLGDHGIYLKGPYGYEQLTAVPLMMQLPNVIKPAKRSQLVELIDIAPTLMELAGLHPHPGMQGKTLLPTLKDAKQKHRDDVYCEYHNTLISHRNPTAHVTMLRTTKHKIVVTHGHEAGELYDLKKDAREQTNLWSNPDWQNLKTQMLKRLCDRMAWTVDPLPIRIAGW